MNSDRAFIERFKVYFGDFHRSDPGQLQSLYADGVVYKGPARHSRGLVELEDYFASLAEDLRHCRFEFLDEQLGERSAYLKWIMHFSHPRMHRRAQSLRGVSHLKWTDRICYQEDFYDTDAMLCAQLPKFGDVGRWLKLRLAS